MSIQILKKGIADSIQDKGRYGYQDLGIQANGYLDYLSAQLANFLVQNPIDAPVFELHFPTSIFKFNQAYTICITGANFAPILNDKSIPLTTAIEVKENDILQFLQPIVGRVSYLAIQGQIQQEAWLNSHSFFAKRIQNEDSFEWEINAHLVSQNLNRINKNVAELVHELNTHIFSSEAIQFIPGPAWEDLTPSSQKNFLNTQFQIGHQANRMGYPLKGVLLELGVPNQYLSSAITRGTIQLLASGEIIVLMSDHQTIGGYANLGQIILVDLPRLAQMSHKTSFHFKKTSLETAHKLYQEIEKKFIHRS